GRPVLLTVVLGADRAAHDLGVARARQVADEADVGRAQRATQALGHYVADLLPQVGFWGIAGTEDGEDDDRLALDRVGHADSGRLLHRRMRHRRRLDFRRSDPLACYLGRSVGPA